MTIDSSIKINTDGGNFHSNQSNIGGSHNTIKSGENKWLIPLTIFGIVIMLIITYSLGLIDERFIKALKGILP